MLLDEVRSCEPFGDVKGSGEAAGKALARAGAAGDNTGA